MKKMDQKVAGRAVFAVAGGLLLASLAPVSALASALDSAVLSGPRAETTLSAEADATLFKGTDATLFKGTDATLFKGTDATLFKGTDRLSETDAALMMDLDDDDALQLSEDAEILQLSDLADD